MNERLYRRGPTREPQRDNDRGCACRNRHPRRFIGRISKGCIWRSTLLRPGAGHQRRCQPHVDGGCRHSSCGTDHRGDITTGILIAAALVLISWVILSVRASALLRAVTHTKSMPWVMFVTALWFGALVVPPLVLTRVVGQLPAWAVVAIGTAGTAIGTGISLSEGPISDPIVAPGSTLSLIHI